VDESARRVALPAAVDRLVRELGPIAVLLHGSRAVGRGRPDSDWDLCVLVEGITEPAWRTEQIGGELSLDLDVVPAAAPDDLIVRLFGTGLRSATVLTDSDNHVGARLIARARALHEQGRQLPVSTLVEQAAHAQRVARRMAGTTVTPELFFFHLSTFFSLAVTYWFDREGRWPEPPYEALESIGAADADYASLLRELAADVTAGRKAEVAEQVAARLLVPA
jgi:hypothetical protein